jgi:thiamine transport system permease protein
VTRRASAFTWIAAAAVIAAAASALAPLVAAPGGAAAAADLLASPYLRRAFAFTLVQAGLSTLLACGLGLVLALGLFRLPRFAGRAALLRLFAVPMALPQLVAVLGLIAIFGKSGLAGHLVADPPAIYGLGGILMAHVFFNMPFAALMLLGALERIPAEHWRLARQAGMDERAIFRLIEWPVLRGALAGTAGLIFMLCAASFTVVLTLGGGPRASTLEVALYQSLRFDFEPARAGVLALVQVALCGGLFAIGSRISGRLTIETPTGLTGERPVAAGRGVWLAVIAAAGLFVLLPLAGVAAAGLAANPLALLGRADVWQAISTSLVIGAAAGLLAVALAMPLLRAGGGFRLLTLTTLAISPAVMGAGWFMLAGGTPGPLAAASVVIAANSLMAMPLAAQILAPALARADQAHDRLCASLGIGGLARLRLVDWPVLRRPLGLAFVLAMAVSLGDLGAIAFFGARDFVTLPYLLYLHLGSYRSSDGEALALILGLLTFALIAAADRLRGTA